ncbi:hypothetical protein Taro_027036 [Colocasia esculenta]|uniref:Uncharacterized protein n=1 Tax=Colocasia esculenta TaxID=4460 RepID=A0A843VEK5_COLES|nr:hypothetical protein [Colocasia esculenta]
MLTSNALGIPLPTLHCSRIPLEHRALVSIYTLSLDLDELSVGSSFCQTRHGECPRGSNLVLAAESHPKIPAGAIDGEAEENEYTHEDGED